MAKAAEAELLSGTPEPIAAALTGLARAPAPDWSIPQLLLRPDVREVVDRATADARDDKGAEDVLTLYQRAVDLHFTEPLRGIAQGRSPTPNERRMLKQTLLADPVQRAIIEATPTTVDDVVQERIAVLQKVWPGFSAWWKDYFKVETDEGIPIDALWRVYLPFSQWIVEQKRAKAPTDGDPNALYVVGVYGSQGRGKTVISRALVPVLNALLDPVREGQAVARAIDDYYLSQEERDALRASGYDPGEQGVSNRGPAGNA